MCWEEGEVRYYVQRCNKPFAYNVTNNILPNHMKFKPNESYNIWVYEYKYKTIYLIV